MDGTDIPCVQPKIRRVNLDTGRENVVIISRRSGALRPEIFRGFSRVELRRNVKIMLATLIITDDDSLVGPDDLGPSDPAFRRSAEPVGSMVTIAPAASRASLDAVRAKIMGQTFSAVDISAIVDDLTPYRYSDAFLISSARFMTSSELIALVNSMARPGHNSGGAIRLLSTNIASVAFPKIAHPRGSASTSLAKRTLVGIYRR